MKLADAPLALLRRPQVQSLTGYSRSTMYSRIKDGLFVKPVKIGPRSVGFPAGEVAEINSARIAGKSDEDIRTLVSQLHLQRSLLDAGLGRL